ncbi:MAG: hydrogenase small subunit [Deltaproteobacteria bacterium]|nr:hydrogenase small subunit [Deltaproteobacteria bacterium]MBW2053486.1 hydrogenase small subunit [Deltaproteobacteria bacterium]MBW2140863.1 hydrogenase small subunit [Deltaproteobacteria bacterium]MBW2323101.1 hydrogenase small subunit [Deltaproteobacteria bacterium]
MDDKNTIEKKLSEIGVSRRDFMKFCGLVTTALGLSAAAIPRVAEAIMIKKRPPVVWLHFAECTGCTEAFFRSTYPWAAEIILDTISLDYHETIMTAAGYQAEEILDKTIRENKGNFIAVVEGAIPTKDNGIYGRMGGRTFLEIGRKVLVDSNPIAVLCVGNCASFGGLQAAAPNPTEAKSVGEALDLKTINISGCPPNAINIVATMVHYLLLEKLPALDEYNRPLFAYGKSVHDQCPRRSHFDNEEFVQEFGDEAAMQGWCLRQVGCKGPETFNNCPIVKFNDGTSWPVEAGHPCIGCAEPEFWDALSPFYEGE